MDMAQVGAAPADAASSTLASGESGVASDPAAGTNPDSALGQVATYAEGIIPPPPAEGAAPLAVVPAEEASTYFCYICYELRLHVASDAYVLDACGHIYCRECLRSMLRVNVREAKVFMKCFVPSSSDEGVLAEGAAQGRQRFCDAIIAESDVTFILLGTSASSGDGNLVVTERSPAESDSSEVSDEKMLLKYRQFKFLKENKLGRLCPYCEHMQLYCPPCDSGDGDGDDGGGGGGGDCDEAAGLDVESVALRFDGSRARAMLCQACSQTFCEKHGSAHRNGSCEAYELSIADETKVSEGLIRENSKACPACGMFISKTGGCNHMKCPLCEQSFCWLCGEWWNVSKCSNLQMNEAIVPTASTRVLAKLSSLVEIIVIGPVAMLSAVTAFLACSCCIVPIARSMPPSRLSPDDSLRARLGRLFTECVGLWGLFWVFMVFVFPYAVLLALLLLALLLLALPLILFVRYFLRQELHSRLVTSPLLHSAVSGRCPCPRHPPSSGLSLSALQSILSEEVAAGYSTSRRTGATGDNTENV